MLLGQIIVTRLRRINHEENNHINDIVIAFRM